MLGIGRRRSSDPAATSQRKLLLYKNARLILLEPGRHVLPATRASRPQSAAREPAGTGTSSKPCKARTLPFHRGPRHCRSRPLTSSPHHRQPLHERRVGFIFAHHDQLPAFGTVIRSPCGLRRLIDQHGETRRRRALFAPERHEVVSQGAGALDHLEWGRRGPAASNVQPEMAQRVNGARKRQGAIGGERGWHSRMVDIEQVGNKSGCQRPAWHPTRCPGADRHAGRAEAVAHGRRHPRGRTGGQDRAARSIRTVCDHPACGEVSEALHSAAPLANFQGRSGVMSRQGITTGCEAPERIAPVTFL